MFAAFLPASPAWGGDSENAPTVEQEGPGPIILSKKSALERWLTWGDYTVIPLPAFSYNRNEGSWIGALAPILKANDKDEIDDIFAPVYLHNKLVGETFSLNYYGYRPETIQYHVLAYYAEKIEQDFDLSYKNLGLGGGRYIGGADIRWSKNAFARFFGFGNKISELRESNYTAQEFNVKLTAGLNLQPGMSVLLTEHYHDTNILDGIVTTLPQTQQLFSFVPGIRGAQILGHGLTFLYDTRDNVLTPRQGSYVYLFGEFNQNLKSNYRNQWWRLTFDARKLVPHFSDRMVFVARFLFDGVLGQTENDTVLQAIEAIGDDGDPVIIGNRLLTRRRGIPFYERPTLGGENTLRGFGRSRFVGDLAFLVNLEERIRILKQSVFDHMLELELAPFLDLGRVGHNVKADGIKNVQINPGLGFRLIARPNVVSRLDVGYGRDGAAVFVGLDYPF